MNRTVVFALATVLGTITSAHAQKSSEPMKPTQRVAVCEKCKMAMKPTDAKKALMKDPMGHAMKMMNKLPKGVKMMTRNERMGGKM